MILSFISQKGGSGKTTLSVNLAALASTNGVPVAIVDLDPQASASAWCTARVTDDIRHEACPPPLLARTLESVARGRHRFNRHRHAAAHQHGCGERHPGLGLRGRSRPAV